MFNFRRLLENSKKFENELRHTTEDLIAVRILENFEDTLEKKLSHLTLYCSKARLLRAKVSLLTSQLTHQSGDRDSVLESYGDTVAARITESQLVKSVAEGHAVKALLTAPDSTLTPEMLERKENICTALFASQTREALVQQLDETLREREEEMIRLQHEWDREMGMLNNIKKEEQRPTMDTDDPMYKRLSAMMHKLQKMSWLAGRLGIRTRGYDWLVDPENRLKAIKLARTDYTVDMFLEE